MSDIVDHCSSDLQTPLLLHILHMFPTEGQEAAFHIWQPDTVCTHGITSLVSPHLNYTAWVRLSMLVHRDRGID